MPSPLRPLSIALPDCIGTLRLDEPGQLFPTESGRCSHLNGTSGRLLSRQTLTVSPYLLKIEDASDLSSVVDERRPAKR